MQHRVSGSSDHKVEWGSRCFLHVRTKRDVSIEMMQGLFWCPITEETGHPSNYRSLRNAEPKPERSFGAGKLRVFVSCVLLNTMAWRRRKK
jgi:hypothetical protein